MARKAPRIPLPEDWPANVKAGIMHVISLAQVALTAARARAKKRGVVARLRAKVEELSTLTLFEGGSLTVFEGLEAGRGRGLEGTRPLGGTRAARGA